MPYKSEKIKLKGLQDRRKKLTDEQRDFYLQVLDSTKEELFKSIEQNGLEKSRLSIFSALLRLRQICCHPRLYDKDNVKNILSSGKFEKLKYMLEDFQTHI